MTSAPFDPLLSGSPGDDDDSTDLGVGGPAEDTGSGGGPLTPPGYAEQVDPAEGPVDDGGARSAGS